MEKNKDIKKLLEGADVCIIATNKGNGVIASLPEALSLLACLVKNMRELEGMEDEMLEEAFRLAFKDEDEVKKEVKDMLKKFLENLFD